MCDLFQNTEQKNIKIRCCEFEDIINRETTNLNKLVFGNHNNIKIDKFEYKLTQNKLKELLQCVYNWNGLKYTTKKLKTIQIYQDKARIWLNGRRSKIYNNTLFVEMIEKAIKVNLTKFIYYIQCFFLI